MSKCTKTDNKMTPYEQIQFSLENNVATITLASGKVNAFTPIMIEEINHALDQAESSNAVVVITGSAGILSGGYDLKIMGSGPDAAKALVTAGSTLARRLLAFPTPVITACSGHAVAKGAFILLASDVRIGVEGDFKIGLNEVQIGMTMHWAGLELAKARLPDAWFNRSVLCAEMFAPADALQAGFLDKVVPVEHLMPTAMAIANQLSKGLDMRAHCGTKLKARKEQLARLDKAIEADAKNLGLTQE